MRAEDVIRIRHMIEAAQSAMKFVANRQRADLATDRMLQFALVRAIEIVGEAVNKVSDETRSTNTGIPWKAIIGMRNRLVHAYFEVDAEILWLVALEHVLSTPFHKYTHMKPRLSGHGGVVNPRDTSRYRFGLRLALTRDPSISLRVRICEMGYLGMTTRLAKFTCWAMSTAHRRPKAV